MKYFLCIVAIILCGLSGSFCQKVNKEFEARKATRECIKEHRIPYAVAIQFSKGEFKDDSMKAKCFLKCFSYRLGFFNETTGKPQKENLLEYTAYLPSDQMDYTELIDRCDEKTERNTDDCDFVYRAYKCFWDEVKNQPEPESLRFSFYDVLGFNELFDEGEIIAEEEQRAETSEIVS